MKKTAVQELRELLFSPVDPLPLALFRVVFGLVLLGSFLTLCPDFDPLFTENSPVRLEDSRLLSEYAWIEPVPSWRWNLFELSPSSTWAAALFILYGFSVLSMTLGWRTRLATLLVFLLTVSIHRREPIIWTGGDFLFQIFAFWLLFVPAGVALSVDAWRRRQEGTPQPLVRSWALLLLQAQLALVYFSTFLLKLQTVSWKSGTALFHAWQLPHYARPWGASLAAVPGLALVSTYGALFFELAFPLLIWNRRFRPWLLLLGASLHLSIELTFRAGPFSSVMLAAYIPFLAPVTLRRWLGRFFPVFRRMTVCPGTWVCSGKANGWFTLTETVGSVGAGLSAQKRSLSSRYSGVISAARERRPPTSIRGLTRWLTSLSTSGSPCPVSWAFGASCLPCLCFGSCFRWPIFRAAAVSVTPCIASLACATGP